MTKRFSPLALQQEPQGRHVKELQDLFSPDADRGHTHDGTQGEGPLLATWQDWTPTYGASGSMTYTSVTTTRGRYCRIGNTVHFQLHCVGTTGGTASDGLTFTPPVASADTGASVVYVGQVQDSTWGLAICYYNSGAGVMIIEKGDGSNYGLGAGRLAKINGTYEVP